MNAVNITFIKMSSLSMFFFIATYGQIMNCELIKQIVRSLHSRLSVDVRFFECNESIQCGPH